MKILHIITSLELGGAERLLTELVPYQKQAGNIVKVMILTNYNSVFRENLEKQGIEIITAKSNNIKSFKNIFEIANEIKKEDYDVVHVHLVHAQYWARMAKLLDGKSKNRLYVTTEHSTSNKRRDMFAMKMIDKFVFGGYDKIVSISPGTQYSLEQWLGRNDKAFSVIYNGIDIEKFQKATGYPKSDIGLKDSDIVLMMVSRFHSSKNHKGVVDALEWLPAKYKVVFVGDGALEEETKEYVNSKGMSRRVVFLGMRKDIPQLLKTADILIQYSYFEGFGITALEGMASKKPVIASDVSGLGELVRGAGIVVDSNNSRELAKGVLSLRTNEDYEKVALECFNRSKEYTLESCANKYLKLYEEKK